MIVLLSLLPALTAASHAADRPPNFIVIFVDNFGAGDLGCYNPRTLHRTPNVDRLATEGMKLMSFYVSSGVCTPSRASLMTGCYSQRVNLHVSDRNTPVLGAVSPKGLHPDETTIAEVLKGRGYVTACIGKWHLGDQPPFLPTRQGFDHYFGIPYSDDMTADKRPPGTWPPLPLMRGEQVIEAPVDRDHLTRRYTQEAIAFMEQHRDEPFFIYLPHAMPGSTPTPYSSPAFRGKSRNGDYGDSVEELDWSTGELMAAIKRLGIDEQTLVVWTSDNGPVRRTPQQGSSAPFKGFGYDTSEGAMRMPCLVRWPGRVPAGIVSNQVITSMDLLPTVAKLAGAKLPERKIDGKDMSPVLLGKADGDFRGHEAFFYYRMEQLQAVRSGPWKLYLPLDAKYIANNRKTAPSTLELYNVVEDLAEEHEVSAQHPQVVRELKAHAERARAELGDTGREGSGQRPAGWVENPTQRVLP